MGVSTQPFYHSSTRSKLLNSRTIITYNKRERENITFYIGFTSSGVKTLSTLQSQD
jgi:hypothetical protein